MQFTEYGMLKPLLMAAAGLYRVELVSKRTTKGGKKKTRQH